MKEKEGEYQRAKRKKPNLYESPTPTRKTRTFLDGLEEGETKTSMKEHREDEDEEKKEEGEVEYVDEDFACLKKKG
jgi:hypothetical protein